MSATVQSIQSRTRFALVPFFVAIVVALSIGAAAGSIATRAVVGRTHPVASASAWDAQKLAAMEGLQRAAAIGDHRHLWDPAKLQAMAGRERAKAINLSKAG